jgi:tetratricopeptide (TPR) repeat protein
VPQLDPQTKTTIEIPYFVLYDSDLSDMQRTGIPMKFMRDLVSNLRARKGLVLSDTCHSAGVVMAGRGLMVTTRANVVYLDEMSRVPAGVGFMAASDQTEVSYERDDLSSGVFTYSLLEGLRGNADSDQDGVVTFGELKSYVRDKVRELTDGKQNPIANTTTIEANRIPLSIVKYPQVGKCSAGQCGTLRIRVPDIDGVEVSVDGTPVGVLRSGTERTIRVPAGWRELSFSKDSIRSKLRAKVEPERSKVVEVNLSFSESDEEAWVEPTDRQVNAFLREDRAPSPRAKELFLRGVDEFNKQRFREAISIFNEAIAANGGAYAEALVYRGRAEQSLGMKDAAVRSFAQALALRPSDFETRTLLAEAKFNAGGNVDEIVRELRQIITRHPNFDFARVVLADVLLWRGDLIGAERELRKAININPKSPPAHMILADVLTYQDSGEKQKEAIAEAERALQLFEEVSRKKVSFSRGIKFLSISHVIFAGARYASDNVMAEVNHMLAKTLTRAVERDKTVGDVGLKPPEHLAYLDRARTHLEKAAQLAEKAADKRRLALVLETSAQNYMVRGDSKLAIKEAERALKASEAIPDMKDLPGAHFTLYAAYKSEQKFSKAAEHLEKFIQVAGSQLNPSELESLKEELEQVKRTAAANRQ